MNRTSAPTRLISVVLAAVLTSTLIPSASIAFASDALSVENTTNEAATEQVLDEAVVEEAVSDAPAVTSAELPISASDHEQTPVAPEVEIVSGSVRLDGDATTILTYAGMSFEVNADAPDTVSLVGVDPSAEGALVIPQTIALASKHYAVTRIITGGGSLL